MAYKHVFTGDFSYDVNQESLLSQKISSDMKR